MPRLAVKQGVAASCCREQCQCSVCQSSQQQDTTQVEPFWPV